MNTVPYSLLREYGDSKRYGVIIGIMNIFVTLGYKAAYILFIVDTEGDPKDQSNDNDNNNQTNFMKYICPICFLSCIISFLLFYVHRPTDRKRLNDNYSTEMDDYMITPDYTMV